MSPREVKDGPDAVQAESAAVKAVDAVTDEQAAKEAKTDEGGAAAETIPMRKKEQGHKLATMRGLLGLSQEGLSKKINAYPSCKGTHLSRSTVSKWESGKNGIPFQVWDELVSLGKTVCSQEKLAELLVVRRSVGDCPRRLSSGNHAPGRASPALSSQDSTSVAPESKDATTLADGGNGGDASSAPDAAPRTPRRRGANSAKNGANGVAKPRKTAGKPSITGKGKRKDRQGGGQSTAGAKAGGRARSHSDLSVRSSHAAPAGPETAGKVDAGMADTSDTEVAECANVDVPTEAKDDFVSRGGVLHCDAHMLMPAVSELTQQLCEELTHLQPHEYDEYHPAVYKPQAAAASAHGPAGVPIPVAAAGAGNGTKSTAYSEEPKEACLPLADIDMACASSFNDGDTVHDASMDGNGGEILLIHFGENVYNYCDDVSEHESWAECLLQC